MVYPIHCDLGNAAHHEYRALAFARRMGDLCLLWVMGQRLLSRVLQGLALRLRGTMRRPIWRRIRQIVCHMA